MPEYTNTEMFNLIDDYIHNARDRRGRSATTGRYVSMAPERGYSRDGMKEKLEEMAEKAPDEHTRQELERLISKM